MINGYLLRDVINKIDNIHFTSSDEIHTLGALYESMLREMRDAAGDSGEFYTPRPVVRFMVEVVDPRPAETVLDPATGTGGFLFEAYGHLERLARTVEDHQLLQRGTIFGGEPKPLPYLLGQMNLLLHGLEWPQIDPGNSLRFPLHEIGEKQRVDVILTNPPFGGEEERGILANFPADRQTAETALLFLQLIMRRLRRQPKAGFGPSRAGVVVPNGTLFGDDVAARIKEELLREFNLHTIGYYELPPPEGRKQYTKTAPYVSGEFPTFLPADDRLADLSPFLSGSTRSKLTQAAMNRIPIPVPPLAEQKRLMLTVRAAASAAASVGQQLSLAEVLQAALTASVLARAFN